MFYFETNTDDGFKKHDCALVSFLREYEGKELSGDRNNSEIFRFQVLNILSYLSHLSALR